MTGLDPVTGGILAAVAFWVLGFLKGMEGEDRWTWGLVGFSAAWATAMLPVAAVLLAVLGGILYGLGWLISLLF